jgi:hypothetical protein
LRRRLVFAGFRAGFRNDEVAVVVQIIELLEAEEKFAADPGVRGRVGNLLRAQVVLQAPAELPEAQVPAAAADPNIQALLIQLF